MKKVEFATEQIEKVSPDSTLVRHGSTVKITKQEGIYTIIYGGHFTPQDPQLLPDKFNTISVETGMGQWTTDPLKLLQVYRNDIQYGTIFERLESERVPLVFTDSFYQFADDSLINSILSMTPDIGIISAEAIIGIRMISSIKGATFAFAKHQLTRRGLLKLIIKGAAAAWLTSPIATYTASAASTVSNVGTETTAETQKLSHQLHPEAMFFIAKIRNVTNAYKKQRLMEYWGNRPHLVDIWGAGHVGIEDEIQTSLNAKFDFLEKISPLLRRLAPQAFYQAVQFKYNGTEWKVDEIFDFPELKALIR